MAHRYLDSVQMRLAGNGLRWELANELPAETSMNGITARWLLRRPLDVLVRPSRASIQSD